MKMIAVLGIIALFALVVYLFIRHHQNEQTPADISLDTLPSGIKLPADKYLVILDKSQLEGSYTDDLVWLEMYALFKKKLSTDEKQKAKWDGFIRKLDSLMHEV